MWVFDVLVAYTHFFISTWSIKHMKAFVEKNKHNVCLLLAKASAKKFMCL